ncbi:MAG: RHS repeat-associated core domain-containing protein [Fimbriimonadaceae bacterium]|nr:MAG: RHS repeat-associated core domain-containing protein [Fimbriimonadaceae bacterium]
MKGPQTVKEFTYDSAGRTTAVETSAGTTSLSYDYESRVTGITYPNQSTNSFTYNGLDTRVGMTDSGGSKTFLRDGVSVTSPVLSDGSATYTPAISERRSSTTTFYHAGIKNGDSQTNTSESVTASVQYDAFGNVTSSSGTWSGPFAYGGPYGYQSDPDSGLKLLGHRYYDPSTGRFLTRDPIKDGSNWYSYCENRPTVGCDPNGEKLNFVNGTAGQQWAVIIALIQILGTEAGHDLAHEVLFGDTVYNVVFTDSGGTKGSPPPGKGGRGFLQIGSLDLHIEFKTADGNWVTFTLVRLIAHELAHMVGGITGEDSEQDAVDKVENPIMKELKGEPRGDYDGWRTKPGPAPNWRPPFPRFFR